MAHSTSTQWPNWVCVNCNREFPQDTKHTKCPGNLLPDNRVDPCGGYLVRWIRYQRKVK